MKIVHVSASVSRLGSGFSQVIRDLTRHQAALGHDVQIVSLRDAYTEMDMPADACPCHACRRLGPVGFCYAPDLSKTLARVAADADIIHSHGLWLYPGIAARRFSLRYRIPHLITVHGMLDPWAFRRRTLKKQVAWRLYEKTNLQTADCLHALCPREYRHLRTLELTAPVCVIPNGVALSRTEAPDPESQTPPPPLSQDDRKTLLFLGRINPQKGISALIDAWDLLRQRGDVNAREWKLLLAGWDQNDYGDQLKKQIQELRCSDIHFIGPQYHEAKHRCYARADAFILPSRSEGLPMAILEAWSHRLPVIMTPECNLPENGEKGAALICAGTAEALAEGMARLFSMPAESRRAMGERGRRLAETDYSWVMVATQMCRVYEWLRHRDNPPACISLV